MKSDHQKWIIIMNYIYINETSISLIIIFKDINIYNNWLSKKLSEKWYISCNNKDWINNIYNIQWLKKCFEFVIQEKVNKESRFLIYDNHDNYISTDFIQHYIVNNIILLLLSSHFSYLLQSFNINIFFHWNR